MSRRKARAKPQVTTTLTPEQEQFLLSDLIEWGMAFSGPYPFANFAEIRAAWVENKKRLLRKYPDAKPTRLDGKYEYDLYANPRDNDWTEDTRPLK